MDPQIKQKIEEVLRVVEHLRRETEETRSYVDKTDLGTALRNHNDSRDEIQDLVRKWDELTRLLNKH